MGKFLHKIFGGLKLTWPTIIIYAVVVAIYTALMATLVPDSNSFHDIVVYADAWVLLALIIILNTKTPLDSALKTFVFFLISQPLIYLLRVPFNPLGWGVFGYYPHWFLITLLTFPAAYLGWYIKKDKWYSAIILSAGTGLLAYFGILYLQNVIYSSPDHLLSTIFCFSLIPVLIFGVLKDKSSRILASVISLIVVAVLAFILFVIEPPNRYDTYNNSFLRENNIVLEGDARLVSHDDSDYGNVEIIPYDDTYNFKLSGIRGKHYAFSIADDANTYTFEYYYDADQDTVVVKRQ